jgi:NAD(P)H-dependent FMN reductase
MPHLQVITGTTRQGRFSEKVASWVMGHVAARDDVSSELVDLRDFPLPFFDQAPPAKFLREYPAVLKNAMDHTFVEWRRKPVTFVGWGNVGGARAIEQLREVAVEFEMAPLRHAVHILPDLMVPAMQAPDPFDPSCFGPLEPKLTTLVEDLIWWTTTLAAGRALAD